MLEIILSNDTEYTKVIVKHDDARLDMGLYDKTEMLELAEVFLDAVNHIIKQTVTGMDTDQGGEDNG